MRFHANAAPRRSIVMALAVTLLPTEAQAVSDRDRADSESVIERQIDAFRRDDGPAAFAFASPELQTLFETADRFMSMVRNGYQPVYRPKTYSFTGVTETESGLTETLSIEAADGEAWTAIYTLVKQPDGSWRITSCHLERIGLSM